MISLLTGGFPAAAARNAAGRAVPFAGTGFTTKLTVGVGTLDRDLDEAGGADEAALYRVEVPAGGGLPPHRHDHLDVFTVASGGGTFHIDDEVFELRAGDSVVVPIGAAHHLEAGDEGATIVVTMLAGTKLVRTDDGSEVVPPWVS